MDNDPKHASNAFVNYLKSEHILHHPTPPQSPDITCGIECVWHELKYFLNRVYKPRNEAQLIAGIRHLWRELLTQPKCSRYMDDKFRTIPAIILKHGEASGF